MRSVREDLLPGYMTPGFHIIIDLNHSLLRKMIPEGVEVEDVSLAEFKHLDAIRQADFIQQRKLKGRSLVTFLKLDPPSEEEIAKTKEPPPHATPAGKLRDLLPVVLQNAADSICYVANEELVLAIKHDRLPADVYVINGDEKR
jgi:hypothetical protein